MAVKILWLCNSEFINDSIRGNGSWLQPLADWVVEKGDFELYNITIGSNNNIIHNNYKNIKQWILPAKQAIGKHSSATNYACNQIAKIEQEVKPDLVHIWGTESIWADVYRKGYIKAKAVLEIQGLISAYVKYYYGGLNFSELLKCHSIKEFLMFPRSLFIKKRAFYKRGQAEIKNIKSFDNISTQSDWVRTHIKLINKNARIFETGLLLRNSFYDGTKWEYQHKKAPDIFSFCHASIPYKGIHILLKAVALVKQDYPNVKLRLAGNIKVGNKLLDGYSVFLVNLIKELGIEDNVEFLGSLNAEGLKQELLNCSVCVMPSFVETFGLALAESMILGVPTVVSYTSAMAEQGEHFNSTLYYNSIDEQTCAMYITQVFENRELAHTLSANAIKAKLKQNSRDKIIDKQIAIYKELI